MYSNFYYKRLILFHIQVLYIMSALRIGIGVGEKHYCLFFTEECELKRLPVSWFYNQTFNMSE